VRQNVRPGALRRLPAENLPALDTSSDIDGPAGLQRRILLQALVRPMSVIVAGELGRDLAETPFDEDQDVIQELAAHRSHELLGKCVRPRRPDWRLDHPRAIAGKDAVENLSPGANEREQECQAALC
jgi:hypothetical protein